MKNSNSYFLKLFKKTLALFVVAVPLMISCKSSKDGDTTNQKGQKIYIDLDENGIVYMSDIFQDIRYLKLENVENHLIGNIQKILIRDDIIFIFETTTPSVFLYDLSGKYLNQITITKGRGPQEMNSVRDFTVNKQTKEVIVLGQQEIHRYSYEGTFLNRRGLEISPEKIALLTNGNYALFMNNKVYSSGKIENWGYNLVYSGEDGFTRFLEIEKYKGGLRFGVPNNFPRYQDRLLLYFHPSYNIYELKSDGISIRYNLDFGDHNVPSSLFKERKNLNEGAKFMMKTIKGNYASYLVNFLETDSLIYFSIFWDRPRAYNVFYLKGEKHSFVADKLVNDVDRGLSPSFITTFEDKLVAHIQPSELLEKVDALKNEPQHKYSNDENELLKFAEDLDPLDNPVIMFGEVKTENLLNNKK